MIYCISPYFNSWSLCAGISIKSKGGFYYKICPGCLSQIQFLMLGQYPWNSETTVLKTSLIYPRLYCIIKNTSITVTSKLSLQLTKAVAEFACVHAGSLVFTCVANCSLSWSLDLIHIYQEKFHSIRCKLQHALGEVKGVVTKTISTEVALATESKCFSL